MGGTSIDDQENRAFGAGDEALEKFNEDSGIDTALLLDHEPHLASRGDRRDEAHAMACAGGFDDRRFALLAPTTPGVMIRAHVGSIAKEDLRFIPLRKVAPLGVCTAGAGWVVGPPVATTPFVRKSTIEPLGVRP